MSSDLMLAKNFCLIVFKSTHHAMAAEKTVIKAKVEHIVVPTPKSITASCGLALKIWAKDVLSTTALLKDQGIGTFQSYEIKENEVVRL